MEDRENKSRAFLKQMSERSRASAASIESDTVSLHQQLCSPQPASSLTNTTNAKTTATYDKKVLHTRQINQTDMDNLSNEEGDDTLGALQDEVATLKKSLENEKSKLNDVPCKCKTLNLNKIIITYHVNNILIRDLIKIGLM